MYFMRLCMAMVKVMVLFFHLFFSIVENFSYSKFNYSPRESLCVEEWCVQVIG